MATRAGKRRYAPRLPPEERREQLLDAALSVIDERGYGGVSMEAIARSAGVTKPVVYDLFGNRGELLMALLEREEERALAQLAAAMPVEPSQDPEELLAEGFRAFLESVVANPESWRLILLPAEGTPEVVRAHVERGRDEVRRGLAEALEGKVGAAPREGAADVELGAHALVAAAEQLARLVLTDPGAFTIERADRFVRELLAALGAPRSR